MALQRVMARKARVARDFQRLFHRCDRVVGDRELHEIALARGRRQAGVAAPRDIGEERAVDVEQSIDGADGVLHARQAGERRAEVRGRPRVQEGDEPIARGLRDAIIDRAEQGRDPGGRRIVRRREIGGRPKIDGARRGHEDILEDHVVAGARAHAEMVPAFFDGDALAAARNDEAAEARLGIVGARPDGEPAQGDASCRIDFSPAKAIAALDPPGGRRRKAAADRRALFRLDQERIAKGAIGHGRTRDLFRERGRKGRIAQHAEMEKILLRQHQRRRGLAPPDRVDDMIGRAQIAARAAERGGNDEGEKPGLGKQRDVLEGKRRRLVMRGGAAGEIARQRRGL